MSLVRIAIRRCALEALRGRTLVGTNVLDSEIGALDVNADGALRTDKDRPFITIYTDAAKSSDNDLRSFVVNGETEIIFEAGIATPHVVSDPNTDEAVLVPGLPATDANFEINLDLTVRQIFDVLSDPLNEWAELFRSFLYSHVQITRARTSGDTDGVRLAAHQVKLLASIISDPVAGVPLKPQSPMARFLTKCEAEVIPREPSFSVTLDLMRAQIAGDGAARMAAMQRFGLCLAEANAMLLTLPDGGADVSEQSP